MKTQLGNDYRKGNVYGTLFYVPGNIGDKFFEVWTLGIWHSFCITASKSKGFLNLYIDGRQEVKISNYTGFLMNSSSMIILLSDVRGASNLKTDITDVNLWKGVKDENFLQKWGNCESNEEGDIIKWSTSQIKLTNVDSIDNTETLRCVSEKKLIASP